MMSLEIRQKISLAKKGKPSNRRGVILTDLQKQRMSDARKALYASGYIPYNKGVVGKIKHTLETRMRVSAGVQGVDITAWDGFKTHQTFRLRMSPEYTIWRNSVFVRDDYRCVDCGARGGEGKKVTLNADHIFPFSVYPRLRFMLENGRTLCVDCHRKTKTWGMNARYAKIS